MKKNRLEQKKFEAECHELSTTLNECGEMFIKGKYFVRRKNIKKEVDTAEFNSNANSTFKSSDISADQKTINTVLAAARKKPLKNDSIIIARFEWLKRNKVKFPVNMELPNLYLKIKCGKLVHAFYSNVLTHVIKKQRYYIQILN